MDTSGSLPPSYFDRVYAASDDPWSFETSAYERDKYARTVAALPRQRYASGFEIGCSIGILTALLAPRCEALLAVDVSDRALEQARQRVAGQPQVRLERMTVPQAFPAETFDLVVLSEVGYYWSLPVLGEALTRIVGALRPGGTLLMVHWTPPVHDYPLRGDTVHEQALRLAGCAGPLRHLEGDRADTYRLDLFERR